MKRHIEEIMNKHCSCEGVENKILLQTISICPSCQALFSTVIYNIPPGRIREVLEKLSGMMSEMGIKPQGFQPEELFVQALPEKKRHPAHKSLLKTGGVQK